jgi:protein gp37
MSATTEIEWTDATWNPVTGCSKITRGCDLCYGLAPSHIWLGVSVEDAKNAVRLKHLRAAQASIKFVSFEPLLGPVGKVDLTGIHWAIVGGESGPRSRPMSADWAIEIRDQCQAAKVAFFFKQWGGVRPKSGGRLLGGREWNQYPNVADRKSRELAVAE